MRLFLSLCLFLSGLCFAIVHFANAQDEQISPIITLTMKGAVSPAFDDYLKRGIAKANEHDAQLVVIKLDTPGGLLTSTRDIVGQIVESPVPIAIWVTPSGAHAASAGTFLLYAAHIAAMDAGTNVGAATPIQMGGAPSSPDPEDAEEEKAKTNEQALEQKALEDTKAFIRGLAELRERNVGWAEEAVVDAKSITASEALELGVIDYKADSFDKLLEQIDGKTIAVKNQTDVVLNVKAAPVIAFEPDWRTKFLSFITDPNVALLLMSIGFYGLILEFYNPGTLIPGTIGAICIIIGLFAMNVLPVNGAGAALMVLGMVLFIAEAFMPSFGILGIGGVVAFVVGATMLFDGSAMPGLELNWTTIAVSASLGVLFLVFALSYTVQIYKKKTNTGKEGLIGDTARVLKWSGTEGRVFIHGENWKAVSDNALDLKKDDTVIVTASKDLKLTIKPEA